jgi:hypothetical protein
MTKFKNTFLTIFFLVMLNSCTTMNLDEFKLKKPELKLEQYFAGKTTARGVFEDRFGNIKKSFIVHIDGTWDGKQLILKEDFIYDDGSKEFREWKITKEGENYYTGFADGVVGVASGSVSGNAFNWKYKFNLSIGNSKLKVDFDDWMFLQDNNYLMNIAKVKKFGITLGTVILFFNKE